MCTDTMSKARIQIAHRQMVVDAIEGLLIAINANPQSFQLDMDYLVERVKRAQANGVYVSLRANETCTRLDAQTFEIKEVAA